MLSILALLGRGKKWLCYHSGCDQVFNQEWLNHGPTAPPFTCPLLWIPEPLGMSEGGIPTAIGGGAEVYNPWLWEREWGLTRGLPAGLPLRCWRVWICLNPSSWIRDNVSSSFIDRASKPAPYRGACLDISSCSDASSEWIYCCKRRKSCVNPKGSRVAQFQEKRDNGTLCW